MKKKSRRFAVSLIVHRRLKWKNAGVFTNYVAAGIRKAFITGKRTYIIVKLRFVARGIS